MPLYDFVVMVKPAVDRRGLVDFMKRLGESVYSRNGVVTNIKSFGRVNLAYGIKKRDGRFFEVFISPLSSVRVSFRVWWYLCFSRFFFFGLGVDTERELAPSPPKAAAAHDFPLSV